MTASLRVKNGIYQMVFSYKDTSGNWKKKSESTGLKERGNKRRAEAMLDKRRAELEAESLEAIEAENVSFLDAMRAWLSDVMSFKVRENTLHQYEFVFKKHISTFEGFKELRLNKLTPKILQDYINLKAKTHAAETVRKHHANIHKFCDYAWKLNILPNNPADKVELPPRNRHQKGNIYNEKQIQQLLQLFHDDILETAILITATYGLRRSEICGLKWDAVDFDDGPTGCIYIRSTAVMDQGKVVYSDRTKSDSSRRRLPLTPTIREHLKALKRKQAEGQLRAGAAYNRQGYICCWEDGTPILPEYVSRHYLQTVRKSQLPYVQLRNLRDSAATILHKRGFDAKSIQPLLGHADASTTANIYIHFSADDLQTLAEEMETALCGSKGAG